MFKHKFCSMPSGHPSRPVFKQCNVESLCAGVCLMACGTCVSVCSLDFQIPGRVLLVCCQIEEPAIEGAAASSSSVAASVVEDAVHSST